MTVVRASALAGFLELVTELGADPVPLLAAARIEPRTVGDPDALLHYTSVVTVIETAAGRTGARDFGRRLALRQGLEILGPVGVGARTAKTVGAALQAIDQYMAVYSPALSTVVHLQPEHRYARFDWALVAVRPPPHRQAAELGVSVSLGIFRLLAGDDFTPPSVHFRHEPIDTVDSYAAYYGCPTRFRSDYDGFTVPRSVLGRPLSDDNAVHEVVRDYLSSLVVPTDEHLVESVARLVRGMLPTGQMSLDLVAAQLAVHSRTLQRHLTSHGTTFAVVVDDVRRSEAERYLRESDVTLAQLAALLGYSEQSALARAFRRWTGTTAARYRRSHRPRA